MGKQEYDFMWSDEVAAAMTEIAGANYDNPTQWPAELREQYENRRPYQVGELINRSMEDLRVDLLRGVMHKRGEPAWFLASEIFNAALERSEGIVHDLLRKLEGAMMDAYCTAQREHLAMIPDLDKLVSGIEFDEIIERVAGANLPPAA